ncbi:MAG TPA: right-handed parallel beta-helix repeat-containing protein, partial [Mycobacterium sp.]|nr:right-handed parallel beta-helix repeat-containing protein [Mycobacterium sp.]
GAGVYRIPTNTVPVANTTILGASEGVTCLDGSVVKTGWTNDGSGHWYTSHTFQSRDSTMRDGTYSVCERTAVPNIILADGTQTANPNQFNTCWDRDQVWWDDTRCLMVGSLAAGDTIGTGNRAFLDRTNSRLYLWADPTAHLVEIDSTPYWLNSASASGVTLDGLTIRRFASPLQRGAASITGNNWTIRNCIFRDNHAVGLLTQNVTGLTVDSCKFLFNGQLGMSVPSQSSGTTPSGNVIKNSRFEGNNQEDFYIGDWEAGGFKTSSLSGGLVQNCQFFDNKGLDLWVDFGARWVFDGNYCDGAYGQAIRIEVATNCIVRNNIITSSGYDIGPHYRTSHANWNSVMDTCAISVSESQYVEVNNNQVIGHNLNGIIMNIRGRQDTHHVFIHDNYVEQLQAPIRTGTSTSTTGTMVAAGINVSGAPSAASTYFNVAEVWSMPAVGAYSGSGISTTYRNEVSNNTYLISDNTSTFRFVWLNDAATGTTYRTGSTYTTKNSIDATAISVPPRPGTRITASLDDGAYSNESPFYFSQTTTGATLGDFDAVTVGRSIWLRFAGVNIPQGSIIDSAYLDILPKGINGAIPGIKIYGIAQDNAAQPTSRADINGRALATATTTWTPTSWVGGIWIFSDSIVGIVQEIVNRPGWVIGNAMMFLLRPEPYLTTFGAQRYVSINGYDTVPVGTLTSGLVVDYH